MKRVIVVFVSFFLVSCSVEPIAIEYNHDECAFCKMKISDVRFGAELVTKKGKIYKYDSAECLVRTYLEQENQEYAHILVTDYTQPQSLIGATTATFLISEKIPSPMGGNLSAYQERTIAENFQRENIGELLSFEQLLSKYKTLK